MLYDEKTTALKELQKKRVDLFDIVALRINFNYPIVDTITYQKGVDSLSELMDKLDKIEYMKDYGLYEAFGIILMGDGSYWERDEYDGYTYWVHHVVPTVEQVLNYNRKS